MIRPQRQWLAERLVDAHTLPAFVPGDVRVAAPGADEGVPARPAPLPADAFGTHRVALPPVETAFELARVPAAVLVPLVARPEGITVLLTQRASHLKRHAGQIAFPGGRCDPEDGSPRATALREAQEEVGLDPARVELLGLLPDYRTRTGFRVTPVVGWIEELPALVPDPREVADVFEVPLAFVLDPANHQRHYREVEGKRRHFYALCWGERYIWGATAAMLVNFHQVLAR